MALAALRVGYLLAAPDLVREISKSVLPYNLNVFSQTAAEVAIEMHQTELKPLISLIRNERDRLYAELRRIPGLVPILHAQTLCCCDRLFRRLESMRSCCSATS
jgi:histidinol-phosphate/aromatic aminotransferase/cobyric acid decarboxylase-like protein